MILFVNSTNPDQLIRVFAARMYSKIRFRMTRFICMSNKRQNVRESLFTEKENKINI